MPAAPLVGAVTTRPPAAFSSLTAIAYTIGQSWVLTISLSRRTLSLAANCGARRRTFKPPGNCPSAPKPRLMQFSITSATAATQRRTSASSQPANAASLANTTSEIFNWFRRHCASNSSQFLYGYGTSAFSCASCANPSSVTIKPPPTE